VFYWHLAECNKFLKEFKENAFSAVQVYSFVTFVSFNVIVLDV
jgi:hypothetical protein